MQARKFQSWYCERRGVPPGDFRATLLRRTLYPAARLLAPLLRRLDHQYFQADHDFIEDVGHIRNALDFADAVQAYVDHFSNRRFLRHHLRLRISVRRMRLLVRETMPENSPLWLTQGPRKHDSLTPFRENEDKSESGSL